jgi:radical SAM-linked protein
MGRLRVRFLRSEAARGLTPKDFLDRLYRAVQRAKLPVARSGTSGHAIAPGPPLAPTHTSQCEYVDFELSEPMTGAEFLSRLEAELPEGVNAVSLRRLPPRAPCVRAAVKRFWYTIRGVFDPDKVAAFRAADEWPFRRTRANRCQVMDLRQSVLAIDAQPGVLTISIEVREEGTPKPEEVIESVFGIPRDEAAQFPTERTALVFAPEPNPPNSIREHP